MQESIRGALSLECWKALELILLCRSLDSRSCELLALESFIADFGLSAIGTSLMFWLLLTMFSLMGSIARTSCLLRPLCLLEAAPSREVRLMLMTFC